MRTTRRELKLEVDCNCYACEIELPAGTPVFAVTSEVLKDEIMCRKCSWDALPKVEQMAINFDFMAIQHEEAAALLRSNGYTMSSIILKDKANDCRRHAEEFRSSKYENVFERAGMSEKLLTLPEYMEVAACKEQ